MLAWINPKFPNYLNPCQSHQRSAEALYLWRRKNKCQEGFSCSCANTPQKCAAMAAGNVSGMFTARSVGQHCHLYHTWGQRSVFHVPGLGYGTRAARSLLWTSPDRRALHKWLPWWGIWWRAGECLVCIRSTHAVLATPSYLNEVIAQIKIIRRSNSVCCLQNRTVWVRMWLNRN